MQMLLTVLVAWLSINFGLPATDEQPLVAFAPPAQMAAVRNTRLAAMQPGVAAVESDRPVSLGTGEDVFAVYDDETRTIYLHPDWTGTTPADVSLLAHELVHHLQNVAGLEYDCPGAREKPAYKAQARWLELFDENLAEAFELDPMTILVRTNCMG